MQAGSEPPGEAGDRKFIGEGFRWEDKRLMGLWLLFQGLEIVFRVGLALLQVNQTELMQLDMEGMSQVGQDCWGDGTVSPGSEGHRKPSHVTRRDVASW